MRSLTKEEIREKDIDKEIVDLRTLIMTKLKIPLKPRYLPNEDDEIGHMIHAKMPFSFIPQKLENGQAKNICTLTLPCQGIWLIHYEIFILNPVNSYDSDTVEDTDVSFLALSITIGNILDLQSVPVICYLEDTKIKSINIGDYFQIKGSETYRATTDSLTLSFNIQSNFNGRIYLGSNPQNVVEIYNLKATRIG